MTVKVRNLDAKGQKVATLVDALAQINGVNLDSVSFDIFDKTPLQNQARADAFKDAKAKAEDYSQLAGLSLVRLVTINDEAYVEAPPIVRMNKVAAFGGAAADVATSVPVGEQEVSYTITVTYSMR